MILIEGCRNTMLGLTQSTKHYKPFEIEACVAVNSEAKAKNLEKHFKTGSCKAILKKKIFVGQTKSQCGKRGGWHSLVS